MRNRLRNSKTIKERINLYIGRIKGTSYSKKEHVDFSKQKHHVKDMDLWLSVGNASNCRITVTKTGKKAWFSSKYLYKVKINLKDIYNFDNFEKDKNGLILTVINDTLGYYPMEWGF